MRLQPLTTIFAGLFLVSLGFNLLLNIEIQKLKKLANKPARIIIERPPEIEIKPKVWGYTKRTGDYWYRQIKRNINGIDWLNNRPV